MLVANPGEDVRVLTLAPGDCCGQTALLEGRKTRAASVRALEDLEVLVISADVFTKLIVRRERENNHELTPYPAALALVLLPLPWPQPHL